MDCQISNQGAAALMDLLLARRGYFLDHHEKTKEKSAGRLCWLQKTTEGTYCTNQCLCEKLKVHMQKVGRMPRTSVPEVLQIIVEEEDANAVVEHIISQVFSSEDDILQVGSELMTRAYLDDLVSKLIKEMQSDGDKTSPLLVAHVARSIWNLSLDTTLTVLMERLPTSDSDVQLLTLDNGSKVLVTQTYLDHYKKNVLATIQALEEPASISCLCKQQGWETSWVSELLQRELTAASQDSSSNNRNVPGVLHGDLFVPDCYTERQHQDVLAAFHRTGLVTASQAAVYGMSLKEVCEFLQKQINDDNRNAIVILPNTALANDMIVAPLEAALQECQDTWLDLSWHVPAELLQLQEDTESLLDRCIDSIDNGGVAVVHQASGLYVSVTLLKQIRQKVVPGVVEQCAMQRAQELDSRVGAEKVLEGLTKTTQDKKRKTKKSSKNAKAASAALTLSTTSDSIGSLPFVEIAKAIVEKYEDLTEYLSNQDKPDYNNEESSTSLLVKLCETAFDTEETRTRFSKDVLAELRRIVAAREAKARTSRTESASQIQNIEAAFEDPACFASACFMIQVLHKFIQYATDAGLAQNIIDILEEEFLQGCCADFTSRITQYALFKNAVDAERFSFSAESSSPEDASHLYYAPVDTVLLHYPTTYLSCQPDQDLKPREPLPLLRNVLPGTVGVSLARQWILCGGQVYRGGVRQNEDGTFVRPGDVNGFLAHVEENCLSICGLPFKKLDKKSEKQLLFARREALIQRLGSETDPVIVLELTIMLLFQLVKNVVVSGSLLRGPILQLLNQERKISPAVAKELIDMAQKLQTGDTADAEQIERVRACGLSREIAKHKVASKE